MQAPGRLSVCNGLTTDTSSHLGRRGLGILAEDDEPHCDCHHDDYRQPHRLVVSRCVPRPRHDALLRRRDFLHETCSVRSGSKTDQGRQCPERLESGH